MDIEDLKDLDDKEIIARSNAQAWTPEDDEYVSIAKIDYDLKEEIGQYPVTFSTPSGTSIRKNIYVVNQPFVKNERANEAVMAFNFVKTVDEITESQALDTDIKTWANAQGWKLSNEDESVDITVEMCIRDRNMIIDAPLQSFEKCRFSMIAAAHDQCDSSGDSLSLIHILPSLAKS